MPEAVATALVLLAALLSSLVGFGWLALAMDTHWQQVRGPNSAAPPALTLRVLGSLGLAASLALCLVADHPSMAALTWVMALAAGALVVALVLAWRPRWLDLLVAWAPVARDGSICTKT